MHGRSSFKSKGLTVIELLVAMVIFSILTAGIYRLFATQSKAYTVQDEVVEIQQNVRTTMEMLLRDLRMTGFDHDISSSLVRIEDYKPIPPYTVSGNSVTVWYENYQTGPPLISQIEAVNYALNGGNLERRLTVNGVVPAGQPELLLENVVNFELFCGTDGTIGDFVPPSQDGVIDQWVNCGAVDNNRDKVIAVRVTLSVGPEQVNPQDDRFKEVSPRILTSIVAFRNLSMQQM